VVTSWPRRPVILAIGAILVVFAPLTLINPERIYSDLLTPSLVALWASMLIVFAVYPRFAIKRGSRPLLVLVVTLAASALAIYGLWSAIVHSGT